MCMKSSLDRVIDLNRVWSSHGPVGSVIGIIGNNDIFSNEELSKLKEAQRLIREVQDNYRETHYKLRSVIK